MLAIGDFAKKTGLTVRALRFYEEKGLISPPRSRDNERRFYGQKEFEQVQKIVSLKQLGFPLSEIEALIMGKKAALPQILSAQLKALEEEKAKAEGAIKALKAAISALQGGDDLDIQTLTRLIRMTTMSETIKKDMQQVYQRYFTEEQMEELKARKPTEDQQRFYQAEWADILEKAKALLGTDPKAPEVVALAERARGMVAKFTGGDPEIRQSLGDMYTNVDEWKDQLEAVMGMDLETFKKVQKLLNNALA